MNKQLLPLIPPILLVFGIFFWIGYSAYPRLGDPRCASSALSTPVEVNKPQPDEIEVYLNLKKKCTEHGGTLVEGNILKSIRFVCQIDNFTFKLD